MTYSSSSAVPAPPTGRRRRSVTYLALGLLAFGTASSDARAQGIISGHVVDDVRGRVVGIGEEVRLLGTDRRVVVDTSGRFVFTDLPAGRYQVAHAGLWLDSLGLPPLTSSVEITSAQTLAEVTLRTPSRALYHTSLCGAPLSEDASALLGDLRLHDASHAALATVVATWSALGVESAGVVRRSLRAVAHADSTGAYRLCGVPVATNVTILAMSADDGAHRMQTDTLVVTIGPGADRLDLVLGPPSPSVALTGYLVNDEGLPAVGEVLVAGRSEQSTRTDTLGAFRLVVAPRSTQLLIRSPGFEPTTRLIDPVFGPTENVTLTLLSLGATLDAVRIVDSQLARLQREFEERRKFNHQGAFIDDSTLARYPVKSTRVLQSHVPRSQVDRRGNFFLSFGSLPCQPRLFVDGADMRVPDSIELQSWLERAKRIEVYRDAFAPARFADPAGCGAIVVWTQ